MEIEAIRRKRIIRFDYALPDGQQLSTSDFFGPPLAVSPDGAQFVYGTSTGIYSRSIDALDARPITGTDQNSIQPFFSPDGQWIGYWSPNDRKLKKIAISGGVPVVLCDTGLFVVGLSWGSDNTIVYSDVYGGGVKRVSTDGGTPEPIIDAELANIGTVGVPIYPQVLPDGKTMLFTNAFSPRNIVDRQITIQSLESGERKVLVGGVGAKYLSTGHLVYVQVNNGVRSIVAVPFGLDRLEVIGGPVPLLEGVMGGAFSDSGTLVYVSEPASTAGSQSGVGTEGSQGPGRKMVWVDFKGQETLINMPPRIYMFPKISPDGTRVALMVFPNDNADIWIWDLERETLTRLTFDEGQDMVPIWSPDSKRIAFHSLPESAVLKGAVGGGVFCKAADGKYPPMGATAPCGLRTVKKFTT